MVEMGRIQAADQLHDWEAAAVGAGLLPRRSHLDVDHVNGVANRLGGGRIAARPSCENQVR
jgi:hypothetical protein